MIPGTLILIATVCAVALTAAPEPNSCGQVEHLRVDERLPCYVVITNTVDDNNKWRRIRILMDVADFSEGNLAKLLSCFAALYPEVEHLSVNVNTSTDFNLGNYTTAQDIEALRAVLAGRPYEHKAKVWEKDAQGILTRDGEVEKFGYKLEGGDIRDMKYVLVKGDDSQCKGCKRLKDNPPGAPGHASEPRVSTSDIPCFFVLGNLVLDQRRLIALFINAEEGTELKLVALLRHVSLEYPEPDRLSIRVYTDYAQSADFVVQALGDADYYVPAMREHFCAALFRESGNDVIRYRRPTEEVTTIIVRGVDISPDIENR